VENFEEEIQLSCLHSNKWLARLKSCPKTFKQESEKVFDFNRIVRFPERPSVSNFVCSF